MLQYYFIAISPVVTAKIHSFMKSSGIVTNFNIVVFIGMSLDIIKVTNSCPGMYLQYNAYYDTMYDNGGKEHQPKVMSLGNV